MAGTICAGAGVGDIKIATWVYRITPGADGSVVCLKVVSVELHKVGATLQTGAARSPSWLTFSILERTFYLDASGNFIFPPFIFGILPTSWYYELLLNVNIDSAIAFPSGGEVYTLKIVVEREDCLNGQVICFPVLKERIPCPGPALEPTPWTMTFDGSTGELEPTPFTLNIPA